MLSWLEPHSTLLGALGAISIFTFIATLVAVPFMVVRLPRDYFVRHTAGEPALTRGSFMLTVLKNILGVLVLLMGVAMLVLPGQGLITMLLGLSLLDFPRKKALEAWLAGQNPIYRSLNWIRRKYNCPPLIHPAREKPEPAQKG